MSRSCSSARCARRARARPRGPRCHGGLPRRDASEAAHGSMSARNWNSSSNCCNDRRVGRLVAAQGDLGDQPVGLEPGECLAHGGLRDGQVARQLVDADVLSGRDLVVEDHGLDRVVRAVGEHQAARSGTRSTGRISCHRPSPFCSTVRPAHGATGANRISDGPYGRCTPLLARRNPQPVHPAVDGEHCTGSWNAGRDPQGSGWHWPPRPRSRGGRWADAARARCVRRTDPRRGRAGGRPRACRAVPGFTQFTRMPSWMKSAAMARVRGLDGALARRVDRALGEADARGDRARVDDGGGCALPQEGRAGRGDARGADHVHVQHLGPLLVGGVLHRADRADAGVC